jgi:type 1 glutamine amidotransferase/sugar phosphate isomerase/epimerase
MGEMECQEMFFSRLCNRNMNSRISSLLALILATAVSAAMAQSQGQPATPTSGNAQLGVQGNRGTGPTPGREAKRWEPWSAMRTAAAPILGWKVGIAADSFPHLTLSETLERTDELSLSNIEATSNQKVNDGIPKDVDYRLKPGEIQAIHDKLFALNIRMVAYRVPILGPDEASMRKVFEFARDFKVETIVSTQSPADLSLTDKLANEFGINVAICGKLKVVLAALADHSKRLGVCGDTGVWLREGIKPIDALSQAKERLLVIGLGDRSALGANGHDVALGTGVAGIPQLLKEIYKQQIKPSLITVDSTSQFATVADLSHSINEFEKALQPVMAEQVDQMARTAEVRGPDRLSLEEKQKIDAALPAGAPAKPSKPRKLLVLDVNIAYGGHRSIPAENYALEMMGKKTGAYETVFSDDLDNLKYPKIKEYDAVYLNNTVGMIFVDPEVRDGLVRFIREGGGLGGNHGTSHASMDWPEFHEMIGVTRGVHRQATEQFWVKVDDPHSPLTAAFHGQGFEYEDEFFRFVNPPYSRDKLHVLLSMDVAKTDMSQGVPFMPGSLARPDADYAVSWIRNYGKGRVFFCILGHNPTLFTSPELAQFFLAGIQFMLGDLKADATPSAKVSAAKGSGESHKTEH